MSILSDDSGGGVSGVGSGGGGGGVILVVLGMGIMGDVFLLHLCEIGEYIIYSISLYSTCIYAGTDTYILYTMYST